MLHRSDFQFQLKKEKGKKKKKQEKELQIASTPKGNCEGQMSYVMALKEISKGRKKKKSYVECLKGRATHTGAIITC